MAPWLVALLISLALQVVAYIIMPKPKTARPEAATDLDNPTAEAGRPIPVVFGSVTIKGPNVLWYGEKTINSYQVKG